MARSGRQPRKWVYRQDPDERGLVVLDDFGLQWSREGSSDADGVRGQSAAAFLAEGPPVAVPDWLAAEIRAEIQARNSDDDQAARERDAAANPGPTPAAAMAARVPPSLWILLKAAALFGSATLLAAILASADMPRWLAFAIVVLFAMNAGFVPFLRMPWSTMLLANFLAAGGASCTLYFAPRLHEVTGGQLVHLASIAEAPRYPNASRFTFPPALPHPAFRGTAKGTRIAGKYNEQRPWSTVATPLVPPGWMPSSPVPAWLVCYGGDSDSRCLRDTAGPVTAAVIPPQRDRADFQAAVNEAHARQRLGGSSRGALMLVAVPSIDSEVGRLRFWTWGAPLVAFGLWLVGWLGELAWRRSRRLP